MAQSLDFTKMHGAGNDLVILDGIAGTLPDIDAIAAQLLDRRLGIGGDQLLVARPSREAAVRVDFWNADGSRAEMCGNGIRAFLLWLRANGYCESDQIEIETLKGIVVPRLVGEGLVEVDMGEAILPPAKVPTTLRADAPDAPALEIAIDAHDQPLRASAVSMGNPHCVVFVDDVDATDVARLGSALETHPAFPERTNVEFVQLVSRDRVKQRTWERGTGETLACGSGACATAVVAMLLGRVERRVSVELRGGTLEIAWQDNTAHVMMTGPAKFVYRGQIELEGVA